MEQIEYSESCLPEVAVEQTEAVDKQILSLWSCSRADQNKPNLSEVAVEQIKAINHIHLKL